MTSSDVPHADAGDGAYGEARWPMAGAVVAAIVLTLLMPAEVRFLPAGSCRSRRGQSSS